MSLAILRLQRLNLEQWSNDIAIILTLQNSYFTLKIRAEVF